MARRGLTYSQTITWLKVLLPLFALALFSTMFLFAQSVAPTSTIPFAKIELEDHAREQRLGAPFLTGQTVNGHNIQVTAASATPDPDHPRRSFVEKLNAKLDQQDGVSLELDARTGTINSGLLTADLAGEVRLNASNGYQFQTEALTLNIDQGTAMSDTTTTGSGPFGSFEAGAMELTFEGEQLGGRFLFTKGVKLIYTP
ncbi:MAG: LPS export ABC transporter periplasmic protein LptC [Cognatishimia sp.]